MRVLNIFALGVSLAGFGFVPVAAQDAATPSSAVACAVPNQPARTLNAVRAETPAEARDISGTVIVTVTLDETSRIVSALIAKSPSALLNRAALDAARASTFQTQTQNCRPVGGTYDFIVQFVASRPPGPISAVVTHYFVGTWSCDSDRNNRIVMAFGLVDDGTMRLYGAFVTPDGQIEPTGQVYAFAGNVVKATSRFEGRTSVLTSTGWTGDRIVFAGLVGPAQNPAPPAKGTPGTTLERMTYQRIDQDHFVHTYEDAPDENSSWVMTSRTRCARIR